MRRGITTVFCGESVINLNNVSDPKVPTLTKTIVFDKGEGGKKSKRLLRLESGESIEKILSEYGSDLVKTKISGFIVNGKVVNITDLYSFIGNVFCVLINEKNKWSNQKNIQGLLVVGSKTSKELEVAGYTKSKESYLPLLLCENSGSVTMLNSL